MTPRLPPASPAAPVVISQVPRLGLCFRRGVSVFISAKRSPASEFSERFSGVAISRPCRGKSSSVSHPEGPQFRPNTAPCVRDWGTFAVRIGDIAAFGDFRGAGFVAMLARPSGKWSHHDGQREPALPAPLPTRMEIIVASQFVCPLGRGDQEQRHPLHVQQPLSSLSPVVPLGCSATEGCACICLWVS